MATKKKTDYTPKSKRSKLHMPKVYETDEVKDFGVIRPPRMKAGKKR